MNLTALFIRRPVMTTLVMIGLVVFGVAAYRRLPVNDLPTVDYPTINVSAGLPGASPETMAATVATPLEKAFSGIAGIDEITSNSSLGSSNITLTFSLDRDIESAAQDVSAAISKTIPLLPPSILPPTAHKQNPASAPFLNLALTTNLLPLTELDEYAETTIAQRLSMVEGVATVLVNGSMKYAVRVRLDPDKLATLGIGASQVAAQIGQNNVLLPTGVLYGTDKTLTVTASGQLSNAADFSRLIVAYANGAPVRLGDLGAVVDDIQNDKSASWYDDRHTAERTVSLQIFRLPGTNTVEVSSRVKAVLAEIERGLPNSLHVYIQYDRSDTIMRSVQDVKFSLVIALVLVVAVIFLFLRSLVATLIPSLTLPMSIIGTCSVMYLLDFSVDNLSLMALTLAVGFVVDDAIVMLENIVRHIEAGSEPMQAALDGAREVGFTILSMTLSLGAVFIPLMFMGGVIGRLFREFAVTIMVAILVSGFVSLTLTPMLCSRLLQSKESERHGRLYLASEALFQATLRLYESSLRWVMRHRPVALAFSVLVLVFTAVLWQNIPKGLFPPDDTGSISGTAEAAQGTSFSEASRLAHIVMERLEADTNIASFTVTVSGAGGATNQAQISVTLKPLGKRLPADVMVTELTRRTAGIPGVQVFFQNPPAIRIGGRSTKTLYQYTVRGSDIQQLYREAGRLLNRLQQEPMLSGVTSDLLNRSPILRVKIDRNRALRLGVSPATIENALADAYNQQQVSTIYTPTNEYWVVMETVPSAQLDDHALERFFVPTAAGKMIPLTAVAEFEHVFGPLSIAHSGRLASVTISFNLAPGASLGAAVDRVDQIANQMLPASITTGFAGTAQAFQASQQGLGILLVITVFLIYIILGILYESFVHPITILSGLPFAAFGALFALYVTHVELGVYGYVGIIMLIGIVKKNAIMMIDFAIVEERAGREGPAAAIVKAATVRFRPIMMTTVSAIAGTLPIAIGVGASAASRRPLGIAVVGGLVFSQVVTLYVTPVFYTYLDELQAWSGAFLAQLRKRQRAAAALGGAPALAIAVAPTGVAREPAGLTTTFIRRPVMTALAMIAILVFGLTAYRLLPVSDLPNVDFPTITVTANMPGSSPQTMAATVATPLEKWFSDIPGIDNMTSTSSLGQTQVVVQFALDRDIDAAAQDIQAAIAEVLRQLPRGMVPPSYQKTNPANAPILTLALTSAQVPLSKLDEYGETTIAQRLSMIAGVAQVSVYGTQKYAVRLQMDPSQLATRGIALEDVTTAVSTQNVALPTGVLWGQSKALTLHATGQLDSADAFGHIVVAYRNGAPVHLSEIGRITDDVQNNKTASWYNGEPAIVLAIQRQPGTNTVEVAQRIKSALAKLHADIPPSVNVQVLYDRSATIEASVHDVTSTLELTLVLVVLVIFLFLRNVSATLIPSLALPMSIIGTLVVMYLLHYSLDNLSLMALTLSVGFVVDDAIVMLENIVRHVEMGKSRMQAAIDGAKEVGFTILSMTFSLAAVFIPFLFMGGIIGKLFHEFAVTIGAAILVSGLVSLTLTPMLSSRFLQRQHGRPHGRLYLLTERFYDGWLRLYERTLAGVMRHRPATLLFSVVILGATGWLFWSTPKGLFPTDDTGQLLVTTEAAEGASFDELVRAQKSVAATIAKDPDVRSVTSSVGMSAATNQGLLTVDLKPIGERTRSAERIARDLTATTSSASGVTSYIQNPPAITIGGIASKSLYQYTLEGSNIDELNRTAREVEARLRGIPILTDVTSDLLIENPQVAVDIDREAASALGVSAAEVENTLYDAFGQRQVSTIYTARDEYWVVLEVLPTYQRNVNALGSLYVRSARGGIVPLSAVAHFRSDVGPVTVNHSREIPAVTISFNLAKGGSLGAAVDTVARAAAVVLPPTVYAGFSGIAAAFMNTQQGLVVLLVLAVFVTYVILGVLYESFVHPVTILTGLPFAAFGALVTLNLAGLDLDMYGFVGMIMLVGIVEKNAIMMIDFAIEAQRRDGKLPSEAILEAASVRFRPIMMTTMAAMMGALPIAVGWGAGASARRPLGVAVLGGLAFSQLVTLYVTPVFYTYFDELQEWMATLRWRQRPAMVSAAAALSPDRG